MKMTTSMAGAAALAALLLGVAAFSQDCGPGIGPCGGNGPPVARAEARLQSLQASLGLQASQQEAWNAYASAVRAQAAGHAKVAQAMNDLYALLDGSQRAALDRAVPGRVMGPRMGPPPRR